MPGGYSPTDFPWEKGTLLENQWESISKNKLHKIMFGHPKIRQAVGTFQADSAIWNVERVLHSFFVSLKPFEAVPQRHS